MVSDISMHTTLGKLLIRIGRPLQKIGDGEGNLKRSNSFFLTYVHRFETLDTPLIVFRLLRFQSPWYEETIYENAVEGGKLNASDRISGCVCLVGMI